MISINSSVHHYPSSFFAQSRVGFAPFHAENDRNPSTGKLGIRSHYWITALFLRIFGKVVTIKDHEGKLYYLNKNSLTKWIQKHKTPSGDLKEDLQAVLHGTIQRTQQIAQPHLPPIETPPPSQPDYYQTALTTLFPIFSNYFNLSSFCVGNCRSFSPDQQAPFADMDCDAEPNRSVIRSLLDQVVNSIDILYFPSPKEMNLFISPHYVNSHLQTAAVPTTALYDKQIPFGAAIYLTNEETPSSLSCTMTLSSLACLLDTHSIEILRNEHLLPFIQSFLSQKRSGIQNAFKDNYHPGVIFNLSFMFANLLLKDFFISQGFPIISIQESTFPDYSVNSPFLSSSGSLDSVSDLESTDSIYEHSIIPIRTEIETYVVFEPSFIRFNR